MQGLCDCTIDDIADDGDDEDGTEKGDNRGKYEGVGLCRTNLDNTVANLLCDFAHLAPCHLKLHRVVVGFEQEWARLLGWRFFCDRLL